MSLFPDIPDSQTETPDRRAVTMRPEGGRQVVFWRPPTEGCAEWGLCESGIGRPTVDEGVADG